MPRVKIVFLAAFFLLFMLSINYAQEERIADEEYQESEQFQIDDEILEKGMPSYMYNLKQLIQEAERSIKKIDLEIKEREVFQKNKKREQKAREHFNRANFLYKKGKLKEAKKELIKVIQIAKNPEFKGYVKESVKSFRETKILEDIQEEERLKDQQRVQQQHSREVQQ